MAKLTDDADYDAGETFENVPSSLSDAGNHDNYYGRRLRTRCVLLSHPDNKTKLRRRGMCLGMRPFLTSTLHTRRLSPVVGWSHFGYFISRLHSSTREMSGFLPLNHSLASYLSLSLARSPTPNMVEPCLIQPGH
ncbi:unnamed protein product [Protopolystoma xenopodis]|uniref:Uncharacterized protein n=1 Tax=Protopolystoma xenopodis TaxID=117903 RepID=A0A3S4ZN28_9PLAT|nr:unnamed protein product [Protopolystoma xenopodis]